MASNNIAGMVKGRCVSCNDIMFINPETNMCLCCEHAHTKEAARILMSLFENKKTENKNLNDIIELLKKDNKNLKTNIEQFEKNIVNTRRELEYFKEKNEELCKKYNEVQKKYIEIQENE